MKGGEHLGRYAVDKDDSVQIELREPAVWSSSRERGLYRWLATRQLTRASGVGRGVCRLPARGSPLAPSSGACGMSELRTSEEVIDERYRVLGALGRGAFAVTYKAVELATGRQVAVKEAFLGWTPERRMLEGLEHEARVLRSLRHPGIPAYVDSFEYVTGAGVSFCLVQELAQGASLWELLREGGVLSEVELKDLAGELLTILAYLHDRERPLLHRDVKPSNIIRSTSGRVALVDFGAAQEWGQDDTASLSDGTRGYMAPEQIRGRATPASDLFGLGATLIFLLTGVEPTRLPTPGGKLEFRVLAEVSREFGRWLDSLVQPDPSRRVPTATAARVRLTELEARVSRRRHRTVHAVALAALTAAGSAMSYSVGDYGFTRRLEQHIALDGVEGRGTRSAGELRTARGSGQHLQNDGLRWIRGLQ